jgi:anti-sigma factor RsiW
MKQPVNQQVKTTPSFPRWRIFSRLLAAALGAYALASLLAAVLALALPLVSPLARADSVLLATLLSFAVYAATAIWVMSVGSASRAWGGLLLASLVLGLGWTGLRLLS